MSSNPTWFNYNFYLTSKLAQLQATDPKNWGSDKKVSDVQAALSAAGFVGETGAYAHYQQYGDQELVSPNQYLNVGEYYAAKLALLQKTNPNYSQTELLATFKAAGLTAGSHYDAYGCKELLNPSNAFDDNAYLAEKLTKLQKDDPTNWSGKQTSDVLNSFTAAGLSPLDHFLLYGKTEGLVAVGVANPVKPIVLPNPGTTYNLTTAVETITGTVQDDTFNGATSTLTSAKTLNPGDKLDGNAGNDTMNVAMGADFGGFSGDGYMKNIETVNLTNSGTADRVFSATGVEGVTTYNIVGGKATVNLTNLAAAGIAVNLDGVQSTNASVAFVADAVKGDSDALTLGLKNVGAAKTTTTAEKDVVVTATGIENLTVNSTGANFVDLSGVADATTIAAAGAGSLKVVKIGANVKSFDASTMTGGVNADLSASTKLATVATGSGDDFVTVGVLPALGSYNGGTGTDTLTFKAIADATVAQPTIAGFENIVVQAAAGDFTLAGDAVTGLQAVTVRDATAAKAFKLVDMATETLALTVDNQSLVGASTVSYDGAGSLSIKMADLNDAHAAADQTGITASKATAVSFTQSDKGAYAGALNFAAAESVSLTTSADSTVDAAATFVADKATNITINAAGDMAFAKFHAAADEVLTVSGTANVNLGDDQLFGKLQSADASALKGNFKLDFSANSATYAATVLGTKTGSDTIIAGAGADTIDLSANIGGTNTITGGKGNDTIKLGLGHDIVKFSATAVDNGVDTITGFTWGSTNDVINVAGFVGAVKAASLGVKIADSLDASALNVIGLTDIQTLTSANFGAAASASVIKTAASTKMFVVADVAGDSDNIQNLYYVETSAGNVATVNLVGTVSEGTLHADNFVTA